MLRVTKLPSRHERNMQCELLEYNPIFYPSERYSNFVNSTDLIDDIVSVAENLKLSLLDRNGNIVADDIATLTIYDDDGNGNGRIFWDIAEFPNLKAGLYRIVIFEDQTNKLYLLSNQHRVITNKNELIQETAYFEYNHTDEIYEMDYNELPTAKVRVRLNINALEPDYPFQVQEYEEVSTGLSQNPRFDVDLTFNVETELYDELAHRAFAVFLAHNDKVINRKTYIVEGGSSYEQDKDINSTLWNGSIKLKDQGFSTINRQ